MNTPLYGASSAINLLSIVDAPDGDSVPDLGTSARDNGGKIHLDQAFVSVIMMIKRTLAPSAVLVSSLALTACGSFGGQSGDFQGRFYAGVGGLVSQLEPSTEEADEFTVDETQGAGGSVAIGYDISPRFSIEGHYSALGEATFENGGTIDYQVGGLSGLLYLLNNEEGLARREGFSVYGRVGMGAMENEAVDVPFERVNDVHLLAGIGAEYGTSSGLGLRLEAVGHDLDALYGQVALVYRLGSAGRDRPSILRDDKSTESTAEIATTASTSSSSLLIANGTPLDSDGDGVLDTNDECSGTEANTPVGDDGCGFFNGVIEGVEFTSGSDILTLEARSVLGQVVNALVDYPTAKIIIAAHTDNQGPTDENLMLSKRRAIAVTRFLVEQGIDGARLAPRAYGESKPRETNETPAGRAANRRVEFNLVR